VLDAALVIQEEVFVAVTTAHDAVNGARMLHSHFARHRATVVIPTAAANKYRTKLAAAAGFNVGLSVLWPKWQNTASRRSALGLAWRDTRRLFLLIAAILLVQAILEMLHVRQVLLHGGSGVPLAPY